MDERSKALRSGRSPDLRAWVQIPPLTCSRSIWVGAVLDYVQFSYQSLRRFSTAITRSRGAMVARLTPDRKVACSNLVGVISITFACPKALRYKKDFLEQATFHANTRENRITEDNPLTCHTTPCHRWHGPSRATSVSITHSSSHGEVGRRSLYLPHAKRALYHSSYIPSSML